MLAAATVLVGLTAPDGLVDVPLRRDVKTILNVVVIGLPASLSTMYLRRPSSHVELGVSRLVHTRCVWWAGSYVAIVSCAAMSLASWGGLTGGAVGLRNSGMLMALTTLSARLLTVEWAWAPALAFTGISLVYGTGGMDNLPHRWAVLQQPPADLTAGAVWALLTLLAWVQYARHDLHAVNT